MIRFWPLLLPASCRWRVGLAGCSTRAFVDVPPSFLVGSLAAGVRRPTRVPPPRQSGPLQRVVDQFAVSLTQGRYEVAAATSQALAPHEPQLVIVFLYGLFTTNIGRAAFEEAGRSYRSCASSISSVPATSLASIWSITSSSRPRSFGIGFRFRVLPV